MNALITPMYVRRDWVIRDPLVVLEGAEPIELCLVVVAVVSVWIPFYGLQYSVRPPPPAMRVNVLFSLSLSPFFRPFDPFFP